MSHRVATHVTEWWRRVPPNGDAPGSSVVEMCPTEWQHARHPRDEDAWRRARRPSDVDASYGVAMHGATK